MRCATKFFDLSINKFTYGRHTWTAGSGACSTGLKFQPMAQKRCGNVNRVRRIGYAYLKHAPYKAVLWSSSAWDSDNRHTWPAAPEQEGILVHPRNPWPASRSWRRSCQSFELGPMTCPHLVKWVDLQVQTNQGGIMSGNGCHFAWEFFQSVLKCWASKSRSPLHTTHRPTDKCNVSIAHWLRCCDAMSNTYHPIPARLQGQCAPTTTTT